MAGEIPPRNNESESQNGSAWDNMEPQTEEVKNAEYYRAHPNEINLLVTDLIRLRGGAASIKEGATWDKKQLAHVGPDGIPRDYAHLTGYLKRNPDAIDAIIAERDQLANGPAPEAEPAADVAEGGDGSEEPTNEGTAVENNEPAGDVAPVVEPEPVEVPAAEPEPVEAPEINAESAETENTHEALVHSVFDYYGVEIFRSAQNLGIDLHDNLTTIREELSDEDTQRLLDDLNRRRDAGEDVCPGAVAATETEGAPETDVPEVDAPEIDGEPEATNTPTELPTPEQLPAPEPHDGGVEPIPVDRMVVNVDNAPEADNAEGGDTDGEGANNDAGTPTNEREGSAEVADEDENNRRRGRGLMGFLSRHRRLVAGILTGITFLTIGANLNRANRDEFVNTDTSAAIESMENQGIIDGYGEEGMWLCDTKTGPYNFGDAEAVAEAIETDDAREMVKYTARNQSESLADYYASVPDELRPEALRGIVSILDMEKAIEGMSDEDYDDALDTFENIMDMADVEDVVLNGRYDNAYMRLDDADGDVTHQNMELVRCTTTEKNTHAKRIILKDKEGNIVGDFIVKANANTKIGKKGCMQVVRKQGSPVYVHMEEIPDPEPDPDPTPDPDPDPTPEPDPDPTPEPDPDPTPEPDPDPTPEPDPDPTPEPDPDPTPEPDPDPTPEPDPDPTPEPEPDPTLQPKDTGELEDNMGVDDSESTNDVGQLEHTGDTERPTQQDQYNPSEQTFGDTAPEAGTGDNNNDGVVDPVSEQVGAQDTNLESADGSGQTIEEVVENADTSTVTEQGEQVSEQQNRTEADQQQVQVDQAAHDAEQQTKQEQAPEQEQAAKEETDHADDTAEEQQQRAQDAWENGDF